MTQRAESLSITRLRPPDELVTTMLEMNTLPAPALLRPATAPRCAFGCVCRLLNFARESIAPGSPAASLAARPGLASGQSAAPLSRPADTLSFSQRRVAFRGHTAIMSRRFDM